jgi:hypothetical protein
MTARPVTHAEVQAIVAGLAGLPFHGSNPRRAVDMEMFNFGPLKEWVDKRGRARTSGDVWLHVQASWRILQRGRIVVGYRDMRDPPDGVSTEGWDPNEGAAMTRRDELREAFQAERSTNPRTVRAAVADATGDLRITFDDDAELQVLPDSVAPDDEYWRLLTGDGPHLVVGGNGAEVVGD